MRYYLQPGMTKLSEDTIGEDQQRLELYTFDTAGKELSELPFFSVLARNLGAEKLQYCKAEMLPGCVIGTLVVPDKTAPLQEHIRLTYYLERDRLIFIDENGAIADTLSGLLESELLDCRDTLHFFFSFLEALIQDDMAFLQNFERRLATMEESIADTLPRELKTNVMTGRRELLVFHSYYQQLMDMCEILSENENGFFPKNFSSHFNRLSGRIDRLYDHTQVLREYALQIREMHQTQVDIRQNETMRLLTVVSTVFFPLSLLTGWYGMNFKNMPELQNPYAYFILIGLCVLIVALEIWYFKKKGWL